MKQLFQLISVNFREFYREPSALFWGVVFPVLMALGLGSAFTRESDITRKIAYVQGVQNDSSKLQNLVEKRTVKVVSNTKIDTRYQMIMKDSVLGTTRFVFIPSTWEESIVLLKRGTVAVIMTEKNNEINYNYDPHNPEAQLIHMQLQSIIKNKTYIVESNNVNPLTLDGTRYVDFLIPGLVAMNVMMACMWGLGYTLIDRRIKKFLRRMVATPMSKSAFLASHFFSRMVLNIFEAGLLFLFAWIYFDVKVQGSWLAIFLIFFSGGFAFTGLAILVSSRTTKHEVGNGLINFITTPMLVLSGVFFSYHSFPDWSIPIIQHLPCTMMADSFRSIMNEGAGVLDVMREVTIMSIYGLVTFVLGLRIFKWY